MHSPPSATTPPPQGGVVVERIAAAYELRFAQYVRVATAIAGDRERGRDAVQDAFARAIAGCLAYRGDGPLEAWLWRAVTNAARNQRRAQQLCNHRLDAGGRVPGGAHSGGRRRGRGAPAPGGAARAPAPRALLALLRRPLVRARSARRSACARAPSAPPWPPPTAPCAAGSSQWRREHPATRHACIQRPGGRERHPPALPGLRWQRPATADRAGHHDARGVRRVPGTAAGGEPSRGQRRSARARPVTSNPRAATS